jgi:hypothetical protein
MIHFERSVSPSASDSLCWVNQTRTRRARPTIGSFAPSAVRTARTRHDDDRSMKKDDVLRTIRVVIGGISKRMTVGAYVEYVAQEQRKHYAGLLESVRQQIENVDGPALCENPE